MRKKKTIIVNDLTVIGRHPHKVLTLRRKKKIVVSSSSYAIAVALGLWSRRGWSLFSSYERRKTTPKATKNPRLDLSSIVSRRLATIACGCRPSRDPFWIASFPRPWPVASHSHHRAAPSALLRGVWIFALGDDTPDGGDHIVSGAVAVGNDAVQALSARYGFHIAVEPVPCDSRGWGLVLPFRRLGDGDTLAF